MSRGERGSDHERFEGDAAAYALGALEDAEVRRFEEHLAVCAQCRDQLAAMREVIEALPAAVPARSVPGELKDRVMASVRAELSQQATGEAAERRARRRGRRPIVTRPPWLSPRLVGAAMAAVAVLAVVGVLMLGGGSSTRTYPGVVHAPGASASLRQSGSSAELRIARLPEPPTGRIYQVWLNRGGQSPQPTRVLFAASSGSVAVPDSLRGVQAVLVTDEPRPHGSLTPTRSPIIVVPLT